MPYTDPQARKAYARAYRLANRDRIRAKKHLEQQQYPEMHRERNRRYRARHPERIRVRSRAWDIAHPESRREYSKAHKEDIAANGREYREKNKDLIRERKREYGKRNKEQKRQKDRTYYEKNRERIQQRVSDYRKSNPERYKTLNMRKRARKRQSPLNDLTAQQWEEIKAHYGHCCVYCGRAMKLLTQDHITPLSKGGSHTASNIVPACRSCNAKKRDGSPLKPVQPLLLTISPPLHRKV